MGGGGRKPTYLHPPYSSLQPGQTSAELYPVCNIDLQTRYIPYGRVYLLVYWVT